MNDFYERDMIKTLWHRLWGLKAEIEIYMPWHLYFLKRYRSVIRITQEHLNKQESMEVMADFLVDQLIYGRSGIEISETEDEVSFKNVKPGQLSTFQEK